MLYEETRLWFDLATKLLKQAKIKQKNNTLRRGGGGLLTLYLFMTCTVAHALFRLGEGLTLETSVLKLFMLANLRYQLS